MPGEDVKPGRVEAFWRKYAKTVVPPDAPQVQVEAMRATFFAGALAVFLELTSHVSDGPGDATAGDMRLMEEVHDELFAEAKRYAAQGILARGVL